MPSAFCIGFGKLFGNQRHFIRHTQYLHAHLLTYTDFSSFVQENKTIYYSETILFYRRYYTYTVCSWRIKCIEAQTYTDRK
jgi:hypothetical protein